MNNRTVRCISLVLIFVQYVLLFLISAVSFLPMMIGSLAQSGSYMAPELIFFVAFYVIAGALMIACAFRPKAFHLLTVLQLVLLSLAIWGQLFPFGVLGALIFLLMSLVPHLLYYFAIIRERRQSKNP